MDKYEKRFYSCYCLFDVCCLSEAKEEEFSTFGKRITLFMQRRSDKILKSGQCSCKYYHPLRFADDNVWTVREIYHIQQKIITYAVCREFYNERIKDIFIDEVPEQKMNLLCYKKDFYSKSVGKFPCCYNFFLSGLLDCSLFCRSCKVFLCSLDDFRLKKVYLIKT